MAEKKPRKRAAAKRKSNAGRKKIKLDPEQAQKLAALQCTFDEIAAFFDVSVDTVRARSRDDPEFSKALEKGRQSGRITLRREQFRLASSGNVTMLIFLGKQREWLGQRDRQDIVTHNEVEQYSAAFIEAGRNLVENIAAAAKVDPEEVLRVFEAEMRAISGKPERSGDGLPN